MRSLSSSAKGLRGASWFSSKSSKTGSTTSSLGNDSQHSFSSNDGETPYQPSSREEARAKIVALFQSSSVEDPVYGKYNPLHAWYQTHPIDRWDMSRVTNMDSLFADTYIRKLRLSWNVEHVVSMKGMFQNCHSLTHVDWECRIPRVTTTESMFAKCTSLLQPPTFAECQALRSTHAMFSQCFHLPRCHFPDARWDALEDASEMFHQCNALAELKATWNLPSIRSTDSMFARCTKLEYVGKIQTGPQWVTAASMFHSCGRLTELEWEVNTCPANLAHCFADCQAMRRWTCNSLQAAANVDHTFERCLQLTSIDYQTPPERVQSMRYTFHGCHKWNQPLNHWKVQEVTSLEGTFAGCISFSQPLDQWDVSKVTNMHLLMSGKGHPMVYNHPLHTWNVARVTNLSYAFAHHTSSVLIDSLQSWNVSSVADIEGVFLGVDDRATNVDAVLRAWSEHAAANVAQLCQRKPMEPWHPLPCLKEVQASLAPWETQGHLPKHTLFPPSLLPPASSSSSPSNTSFLIHLHPHWKIPVIRIPKGTIWFTFYDPSEYEHPPNPDPELEERNQAYRMHTFLRASPVCAMLEDDDCRDLAMMMLNTDVTLICDLSPSYLTAANDQADMCTKETYALVQHSMRSLDPSRLIHGVLAIDSLRGHVSAIESLFSQQWTGTAWYQFSVCENKLLSVPRGEVCQRHPFPLEALTLEHRHFGLPFALLRKHVLTQVHVFGNQGACNQVCRDVSQVLRKMIDNQSLQRSRQYPLFLTANRTHSLPVSQSPHVRDLHVLDAYTQQDQDRHACAFELMCFQQVFQAAAGSSSSSLEDEEHLPLNIQANSGLVRPNDLYSMGLDNHKVYYHEVDGIPVIWCPLKTHHPSGGRRASQRSRRRIMRKGLERRKRLSKRRRAPRR